MGYKYCSDEFAWPASTTTFVIGGGAVVAGPLGHIFFKKYLKSNIKQKLANYEPLIKYFNKFQSFCFDLSSDSVLKGEINFNYN